ncbi:MAG: hypothetical protein WCP34_09125 [Pseudomonadota bacterium]
MIITKKTTDLTLPDGDFWWADELTHDTVGQTVEESVDGSVIIEPFEITGGRLMTLDPTGPSSGWLALADWQTLRTWSAIKGQTFTVTYANADAYSVIFARPAFDPKPVKGFSNRDTAEWWRGSVHFIVLGQQ